MKRMTTTELRPTLLHAPAAPRRLLFSVSRLARFPTATQAACCTSMLSGKVAMLLVTRSHAPALVTGEMSETGRETLRHGVG